MFPRTYPDLARTRIADMERAASPRRARRREASARSGLLAWHRLVEQLAPARLRPAFGSRGISSEAPACSTIVSRPGEFVHLARALDGFKGAGCRSAQPLADSCP